MNLLLATRNPHKTREFRELLGGDFQVVDLSGLAIEEIEETGKSFAENATVKAVSVSKQLPGFVIADDSGLEVDALDGAPGIFSARYAGENASDVENIEKLLHALKNITNRSARFRCAIALAQQGKLRATFEGAVEGVIVDLPRGINGFGYDPIFQPTGFKQTFADMAAAQKNKISHRAKAIAASSRALREIKT